MLILSYIVIRHYLHTCVCGHARPAGKAYGLDGGRKTTEATGNNKQWPKCCLISIPTIDNAYVYNGYSIKDYVLHNNMMGTRERVSLHLVVY